MWHDHVIVVSEAKPGTETTGTYVMEICSLYFCHLIHNGQPSASTRLNYSMHSCTYSSTLGVVGVVGVFVAKIVGHL